MCVCVRLCAGVFVCVSRVLCACVSVDVHGTVYVWLIMCTKVCLCAYLCAVFV